MRFLQILLNRHQIEKACTTDNVKAHAKESTHTKQTQNYKHNKRHKLTRQTKDLSIGLLINESING